jgi:hypothetical protein
MSSAGRVAIDVMAGAANVAQNSWTFRLIPEQSRNLNTSTVVCVPADINPLPI